MKRIYLLVINMFLCNIIYAQVKIGLNPNSLNSSAVLELESTTKGFILPRLTTTEMNNISSAIEGMMVFNTDSTTVMVYDGNNWLRLINSYQNKTESWLMNGNINTTSNNFIGTKDAQPLQFKTNNVFSGSIEMGGSTEIGYQSGLNNATNTLTSFGYRASKSNTNGAVNSSFGHQALTGTTSGDANNAFGYKSLNENTTGNRNAAFGRLALNSNLSGNDNIAIGDSALFNNTVSSNIAIGSGALMENVSGANNIAIGLNALKNNSIGQSNIAIGTNALLTSPFSSHYNVAIGHEALKKNTSVSNTAIGYRSMFSNTSGDNNAAVGANAMFYNTSGNYNSSLGSYSLYSNTTGSYNIAFGNNAGRGITTESHNICIGYYTQANSSLGYNVAIGSEALRYNTGANNIGIGHYTLSNVTASNCIAIGNSVLDYNTSGYSNLAIGTEALAYNTSGDDNTAFGYKTLYINTGSKNCSVGNFSLFSNTTGSNNTAIGYGSDVITSALTNATAVGYNAVALASNAIVIGNSSVGSIGGYVSWTTLSDGRFKKNVKEQVPGLAFIKKLRPVIYNLDMNALAVHLHTPDSLRLNDAEKQKEKMIMSGFIAQEVENAANELNYDFSGVDKPKNEHDHYSLRYAEFTVPLVKAVQELSEQNELLKLQLLNLKKQNDNLISEFNAIKTKLK